jgi:anti-sigma factor RsiW
MQHLDEGTIHGWLDGALSVDEAARVEAHVNECPECAQRVAEARGLIAASSRILTALDSVPNRVLPQTRAKSRNWVPWRTAAAVAVVVAGTLVVTKERAAQRHSFATIRESAPNSKPPRASPVTVLAKPSGTAGASTPQSMEKRSDQVVVGGSVRAGLTTRVAEQTTPTSANGHINGAAKVAALGAVAGVVEGSGEPFAATRPAAVALDAVAARTPRIVGNPSVIGEKRTLYEVAPGDTVLLAESEGGASNMVVTGIAMAATPETTTAPQAQRKASAPAQARPRDALMSSAPGSNGVNTIVWTDAATGKVMKLSGHHSQAELEDIRRRIEQARAAESTKAKAP